MAKITIDGVDFDSDVLTDDAKAQLASLQFCDAELQRLKAEAASIQTARVAYAHALKVELRRIDENTVAEPTREASRGAAISGDENVWKNGFFGGLFAK